MRNVMLTLLLMAVGIWWFSRYGPMVVPEAQTRSGWMLPGDGPGESDLAISGAGTELAVVSVQEKRPDETDTGDPPDTSLLDETIPEVPKEVTGVDLFLIGYAAGVAAVLVGMFAGPIAARLWKKIHNNHT